MIKISDSETGQVTPGRIVSGLGVVAGLLGLSLIMGSWYHIDQKEVGVVTKFGRIVGVAEPGLNFKMPFIEDVTKYDTSIQQISIHRDAANSTDNQIVYGDLNIQYYVTPSSVKLLYSRYPNYEQRVNSLAQDIFRQVIGKYDTSDIPTHRQEIEQRVFSRLSEESMRLYGIQISEVQCVGFDYAPIFKASIDQMTRAKARERQAEIERDQASIEAQKKKIDADADMVSAKARADGEAYSTMVKARADADRIRLQGQAQADSIKAQTEALKASPEFVHYTAAKQWNGVLPTSIGVGASSSSIPMLNLSGLTQGQK